MWSSYKGGMNAMRDTLTPAQPNPKGHRYELWTTGAPELGDEFVVAPVIAGTENNDGIEPLKSSKDNPFGEFSAPAHHEPAPGGTKFWADLPHIPKGTGKLKFGILLKSAWEAYVAGDNDSKKVIGVSGVETFTI